MPKVNVYNLKKESVGELDLADDVFAVEVNENLFYEVVKAQLASRRQGTRKVKNRAEIRGTRAKMYRQKGTGRARHGDEKAPQFRPDCRSWREIDRCARVRRSVT